MEKAPHIKQTNVANAVKQIENILEGDLTPVKKLQLLVSLGVEEEDAELLVDKHQSGGPQPVYYEELTLYEDDSILHS